MTNEDPPRRHSPAAERNRAPILAELRRLLPEVVLSGRFERSLAAVDLDSVLREIDDARFEEAARQRRLQEQE